MTTTCLKTVVGGKQRVRVITRDHDKGMLPVKFSSPADPHFVSV